MMWEHVATLGQVEMTPIFDPLNLVLLAIAFAVFWRLKSVLGRRTGNERAPAEVTVLKPRNGRPADVPTDAEAANDVVVKPVWHGFAEQGSHVASGLEAIAAKAPDFAVAQFLDGAKRAYELILTAYAKGDKAALKLLLGKDVLESFATMIDQYKADGTALEFQFVGVNSVKIENATLAGRTASLTLRFNSEMIHALKNREGEVIEGQEKAVRTVEDVWTFERDTGSRDPNWKLAATDDDIG